MKISREKFISLLSKFEAQYEKYSDIIHNLYHHFDIDLSNAFDGAAGWEIAIEAIAVAAGVDIGDISWFVYENDFGRKELECSYDDGPMIPIKNAGDFYDLLALCDKDKLNIEQVAKSAINVINELAFDAMNDSCEFCIHLPEGGDGQCPLELNTGDCNFKPRTEAMYEKWKVENER